MTQMNARLEIASRLMAALFDFTGTPKGHAEPTPPHMALMWADALIAEEARTRPPVTDAPAPDDLRAVAEELYAACVIMARHGRSADEQNEILRKYGWSPASRETTYWFEVNFAVSATSRARAIGLGGGK